MDNFRMEIILNRQKEIKKEYLENEKLIDVYLNNLNKLYKEEAELKILECKIIVECLN